MQNSRPRRLTRSRDQMLAGVAGGIADYFSIDPTVIRIVFVIAAFMSLGTAILGYIVLAVVLPAESDGESASGTPGSADPAARAAGLPDTPGIDGGVVLGIALVLAGFFVLFQSLEVLHWFGWRLFEFWWPGLLIVAGIALILMRRD